MTALVVGAVNVHVDGFSDNVHRTGDGDEFGYKKSMDAQTEWREKFAIEQQRLVVRSRSVMLYAQCIKASTYSVCV